MKRTKSRWLVTAAAATSLLVSSALAAPALADEPSDGAMTAIALAAPEAVADAADIMPNSADTHAIDASIAGTQVVVPTDPADEISVADGDAAVSIGLPFASHAADAVAESAGTVSYDNGNGSVTVPLVRDDGSMQINTVIAGAASPIRYPYTLGLPDGGRIQRVDGGALALLDADSRFIGGLAPAWAVDANGRDVATHYEVAGTVVTQVVEHSAANAYPVVADPYLGLQMVQSASWTTGDSRGRTLVVTPTGWARAFGGAYLAGVYGWPEVEQRQSAVRGNTQLHWQNICHQQFAFVKATWNLDTWVRRGSYANSVAHTCN